MSGGSWATQRERRQNREEAREQRRRLLIEFQDKLWLAQNHPVADSVLAWLAENRAEASKIGSSRWNLEILPGLVARQDQLRKAEAFQAVLARAEVSRQTVTTRQVLEAAGIPQNPQNQSVETTKRRAPRRDAGRSRPSRKSTTTTTPTP